MHAMPDQTKAVKYVDDAARDWLANNLGVINAKWKSVTLSREPQACNTYQDESGKREEYSCSPSYILTYYKTRFRWFGGTETATVRFAERDIHSVEFRRSSRHALWDAHYRLTIVLQHGCIEVFYTPPFFGRTPIAGARHSEEVTVMYDLYYTPKQN